MDTKMAAPEAARAGAPRAAAEGAKNKGPSLVIQGPRPRGRGPWSSTTPYEWVVEIRRSVEGGREFFFLLLTPRYGARAGRIVLPALEVEALARMIRARASLRALTRAPLGEWGALPGWLRRKLAREVLPVIALFIP